MRLELFPVEMVVMVDVAQVVAAVVDQPTEPIQGEVEMAETGCVL
jgi:hypothetical protein